MTQANRVTVGEAVRTLAARINRRRHADGGREARLLVEHVTGLTAGAQLAKQDDHLDPPHWVRLDALVQRREAGEPLARILGRAPFWDFDVGLNAATLVPRDDTGTLVEVALAHLPTDRPVIVADLGTGSGIILLALARERPLLRGLGIDVSPQAVAQAEANAKTLGVQDHVRFLCGSWLEGVTDRFDMIVSNPPYVRSADMDTLDDEVRLHDPRLALVAGWDGLEAYRALLPQAVQHLRPGGTVLLEIGYDQAEAVSALAIEAGFETVSLTRDLSGQPRVLHLHHAE